MFNLFEREKKKLIRYNFIPKDDITPYETAVIFRHFINKIGCLHPETTISEDTYNQNELNPEYKSLNRHFKRYEFEV